MRYIFAFFLLLIIGPCSLLAQSYVSYFTGSTIDVSPSPFGGICIMGGASENDNAMAWFLHRANGGDILVLRASGSDGYNDYLYSELGVSVNSVETIKFNSANAALDPYVHDRIQKAEAIWFAGGDQWDYVSYWRNTIIDSLINLALNERNIVIGGTSAGMAIQGGHYFSAENGTVSSAVALENPYDYRVKVASDPFLNNTYLSDVITDTHYDNPDRRGRHTVFLARILQDLGYAAKGIACDEYTAVCINHTGLAFVFGDYPSSNDNAYFIQSNCELSEMSPENCSSGFPLHWDHGGEALKVCVIKGTSAGLNTFNLNDWKTSSGGNWEHWSISNGVLSVAEGEAPNCTPSSEEIVIKKEPLISYSNPVSDFLTVKINTIVGRESRIVLKNSMGVELRNARIDLADDLSFSIAELPGGIYFIELLDGDKMIYVSKVKIIN